MRAPIRARDLRPSAGEISPFAEDWIMADDARRPERNKPADPKAPKPEKDDVRLRDTSRPAHTNERERDRNR